MYSHVHKQSTTVTERTPTKHSVALQSIFRTDIYPNRLYVEAKPRVVGRRLWKYSLVDITHVTPDITYTSPETWQTASSLLW
jgi:hypothetical protein